MTLGSYLLVALVIAACIPVVEMIRNWYFLRSDLGIPWPHGLVSDTSPRTQRDEPLVREGVRTHMEKDWVKFDLSGMPAEIQEAMKRLSIGFDGRQYTLSGYRYDRLSDAINYAELIRSRSSLPGAT